MKSSVYQNRVTAKDIAKAAGVSQAAVSMALRGSPEIGEERSRQIREIANRLKYHPRAAAQLLSSKHAGQIGVLVAASSAEDAFSAGFTGPLVGSVIDICVSKGLQYVIEFHSHVDDAADLKAPPYQVRSGLVDGSIFIGDVGDAVREMLAKDLPGFPWVSIDEPAPYCVINDSRQGVLDVVRRLHGLGHRRIAYMCGPQRYLTHQEGFAGWQQAVKELRLPDAERRQIVIDVAGNAPLGAMSQLSVQWSRKVLREEDRPTAIVCHDSHMARAVIFAATELNLAVPRDLSVTSWGWHVYSQKDFPSMSTVEFDFRTMVTSAVGLLDNLIADKPIEKNKIIVPPRYVEGATVAPPPRQH
jgi:LacI family transcriptional regulator